MYETVGKYRHIIANIRNWGTVRVVISNAAEKRYGEKYQERKWIPFTTSSSYYFSCIVTHCTMVQDTFLFYFDDLWFITRIVRDKFVLTDRKVIITKSQWFLQAIENIDKSHLHGL